VRQWCANPVEQEWPFLIGDNILAHPVRQWCANLLFTIFVYFGAIFEPVFDPILSPKNILAHQVRQWCANLLFTFLGLFLHVFWIKFDAVFESNLGSNLANLNLSHLVPDVAKECCTSRKGHSSQVLGQGW
jgi:hypothetical protein